MNEDDLRKLIKENFWIVIVAVTLGVFGSLYDLVKLLLDQVAAIP